MALPEAQRRQFPPVCPELVGEVRLPADGLAALRRKMLDYLANGGQLGFLPDPTAETATVYRPGQKPQELAGFGREVSGEAGLPGLQLDWRPRPSR